MPGGRACANADSAASTEQSIRSTIYATIKKPVRLNPCVQCTPTYSNGFCIMKSSTISINDCVCSMEGVSPWPRHRNFVYLHSRDSTSLRS